MVLRLRKLVDKMTSRELERWKLVLTDWRHPPFFFCDIFVEMECFGILGFCYVEC